MAELDSTSSEIVAYHKVKRRFINLKDMQSEDPDLLQIYEFKGQDFDLVRLNTIHELGTKSLCNKHGALQQKP